MIRMRTVFFAALVFACCSALALGRGIIVYPKSNGPPLTTDQIKARLEAAELSPAETLLVISAQDPDHEEPVFGDLYAFEIMYLFAADPQSCFDEELGEREQVCERLAEYEDDSLSFHNLLEFCVSANDKVFEYCADKMNPYRVSFDLYDVGESGRLGTLTTDQVIYKLNQHKPDLTPQQVALILSEARDKQAKLLADNTVQDYLNLNAFELYECEPEALRERAKLCRSLQRGVEKIDGQKITERLCSYCRYALHEVGSACLWYKNDPVYTELLDHELWNQIEHLHESSGNHYGDSKLLAASKSNDYEKFLENLRPDLN